MCLTADPGVASLILACFHTFVEIDHEIISMAILLPLIQEGMMSITSESIGMKYWLTQCCAKVKISKFQRDICKLWGTHRIHLFITCKVENSFPEISVHFYLNLSSMSIVLAQEGVQITTLP